MVDFQTPDFFQENTKSLALMVLTTIGLLISFVFIAANVQGQTNALFIYTLMFLGFVIGLSMEIIFFVLHKNPQFFSFIGLGNNMFLASSIGLIALWTGYFLVSINLTIPLPLAVTFGTKEVEFLYTTIFSPIIEDAFFRGFIIPTIAASLSLFVLSKKFGTQLYLLWFTIAMILSGVFFGISHYLAYGYQPSLIFNAIVWAIIVAVLMLISRSILPAILMHFSNNITIALGKASLETTIWILIILTIIILAINIFYITRVGIKKYVGFS